MDESQVDNTLERPHFSSHVEAFEWLAEQLKRGGREGTSSGQVSTQPETLEVVPQGLRVRSVQRVMAGLSRQLHQPLPEHVLPLAITTPQYIFVGSSVFYADYISVWMKSFLQQMGVGEPHLFTVKSAINRVPYQVKDRDGRRTTAHISVPFWSIQLPEEKESKTQVALLDSQSSGDVIPLADVLWKLSEQPFFLDYIEQLRKGPSLYISVCRMPRAALPFTELSRDADDEAGLMKLGYDPGKYHFWYIP